MFEVLEAKLNQKSDKVGGGGFSCLEGHGCGLMQVNWPNKGPAS